jgi:cation transporter-like permease
MRGIAAAAPKLTKLCGVSDLTASARRSTDVHIGETGQTCPDPNVIGTVGPRDRLR